MSLDRLRTLVPPPESPLESGDDSAWGAVEEELGTALPGDYKQLVRVYGTGMFDGFLYLFNPFSQDPHGNLVEEGRAVLSAYTTSRSSSPDRLPMPPYPEPGGLLPVGRTENGDELYWVTDGTPDTWPVCLLSSRASDQETHRTTVTGFLADWFAGDLTTRVFPADVLRRDQHEFSPG